MTTSTELVAVALGAEGRARAPGARVAARAPTPLRRRARGRRRWRAGRSCRSRRRAGCRPRAGRSARTRAAHRPAARRRSRARRRGRRATSSSSTRSAGTRTCSAKPPGSSPVALKRSHSVSWPRRQRRHSPHGAWWCTTTRSPTATPSTSAPTAVTSPASSWPRTVGTLRATHVSRTSEPHTPHASTRQTTSPLPGSGSAACSTRTSRGVSERATLMPAARRRMRRRAGARRRAR